jgi:hypothetical protein
MPRPRLTPTPEQRARWRADLDNTLTSLHTSTLPQPPETRFDCGVLAGIATAALDGLDAVLGTPTTTPPTRTDMPEPEPGVYHVTWSDEDQEYIGTYSGYPSLSHLDTNPGKALTGIQNLVKFVRTDTPEAP